MHNKEIEEDLKYVVNQNLNWEQFKNKTILISGATGFIASWIIDTFIYLNKIKNYNIKIIAIVRNIEKAKEKFENIFYNDLIIYCRDICEEIKIDEYDKIDYIIHTASIATPKLFKSNPVDVLLPNIIGTNNLLKLAVEKKVKDFIYFSTSGVYGNFDKILEYTDEVYLKEFPIYPIREDFFGSLDSAKLSSCYLESKRAGENLCIAYMHQYGVPVKIIRPSIVYGYGVKLDDGRSFADFINSILNKKDISLTSDGKAKRSFLYIADFISGLFHVILKGKNGEAYNIASLDEISIIDLAESLVKDIFSELNLKVILINKDSKKYLRSEFLQTWMSTLKLQKLGWKINFNLKEGFQKTIKYYKASKSNIHF